MRSEIGSMKNEAGNKRKIQDFKDLDAWRVAHRFVLMVYKATREFPREELYGLANQVQRAAVSVVSNIAEGFNRRSYIEKARFYEIALGSIAEVRCQLEVAKDPGYIGSEFRRELIAVSLDVHKIVNGLVKGARKRMHSS